MKKADIRPGLPYGYQEGKHRPLTPVVLLSTDLYVREYKGTGGPPFRKVPPGSKSVQIGPKCGYPAVLYRAYWRHGPKPDLDEIAQRMTLFTLADFESAQASEVDDDLMFGIVDRLACVLGSWATVSALDKEKRRREREERERVALERQRNHERVSGITAALAAAGIEAGDNSFTHGTADRITLTLDAAERVVELLHHAGDRGAR